MFRLPSNPSNEWISTESGTWTRRRLPLHPLSANKSMHAVFLFDGSGLTNSQWAEAGRWPLIIGISWQPSCVIDWVAAHSDRASLLPQYVTRTTDVPNTVGPDGPRILADAPANNVQSARIPKGVLNMIGVLVWGKMINDTVDYSITLVYMTIGKFKDHLEYPLVFFIWDFTL